MDNVVCPYFKMCNQTISDPVDVKFSSKILVYVFLIVSILTFLFILYGVIQVNKTLGDIFLGVGAGIFAGTIFAFSIRTQRKMFLIYSLAGLVFLICGAILKNLN